MNTTNQVDLIDIHIPLHTDTQNLQMHTEHLPRWTIFMAIKFKKCIFIQGYVQMKRFYAWKFGLGAMSLERQLKHKERINPSTQGGRD